MGRWELLALVAEGSVGQVYRGRAADSPHGGVAPYAVKLLRTEWELDRAAVAQFRREAEVGRAVAHPHVVPILAAGLRRPPYYLVMPWLEGHTLRQRLDDLFPSFVGRGAGGEGLQEGRQQGSPSRRQAALTLTLSRRGRGRDGPTSPFAARRLDVPVALWIARQVAEAMAALAAAGWQHGDIQPANIFLSPATHVTLLDLGLARRANEPDGIHRRAVAGTMAYLAPERFTSALAADPRSDVYSLGAVLYEMLAGRVPFEGGSIAELADAHLRRRPPALGRLVSDVPPAVTRLVERMLSKDPLRRPQTAAEMVGLLTRLEIESFADRASG